MKLITIILLLVFSNVKAERRFTDIQCSGNFVNKHSCKDTENIIYFKMDKSSKSVLKIRKHKGGESDSRIYNNCIVFEDENVKCEETKIIKTYYSYSNITILNDGWYTSDTIATPGNLVESSGYGKKLPFWYDIVH